MAVLDAHLSRLAEPTGVITELRCGGARVRVQHDGASELPGAMGGRGLVGRSEGAKTGAKNTGGGGCSKRGRKKKAQKTTGGALYFC